MFKYVKKTDFEVFRHASCVMNLKTTAYFTTAQTTMSAFRM